MTTKQKMMLSIGAVVLVHAASGFIGWLSGYNFNERGPGVAVWEFFTLLLSCVATLPIWLCE